MAVLNILSRRWVLRIIWELREEPRGFREIQARCDRMSPDTLSTRLSELQEAQIVEHDVEGSWTLTDLGRRLGPALKELDSWSRSWERALRNG